MWFFFHFLAANYWAWINKSSNLFVNIQHNRVLWRYMATHYNCAMFFIIHKQKQALPNACGIVSILFKLHIMTNNTSHILKFNWIYKNRRVVQFEKCSCTCSSIEWMPKLLVTLQHLNNLLLLQGNFCLQKFNEFNHLSNYCVIGQVPSTYTINTFNLKISKMLIVGCKCTWPLQFSYPQTTIMPIIHHSTQKPNKPPNSKTQDPKHNNLDV